MNRFVVVMIVVVVAGCATKRVSGVDPEARQQIGYAATATYPGNPYQRPDKVNASAAVDHEDEEIQIYNLSDNAIVSPKVWVNGAYVRQLPTIGPRAAATVEYRGLLQAGEPSMDFKRAGQAVSKVEIQTADGLFTVQGPSRVAP